MLFRHTETDWQCLRCAVLFRHTETDWQCLRCAVLFRHTDGLAVLRCAVLFRHTETDWRCCAVLCYSDTQRLTGSGALCCAIQAHRD